jgi:peptidoglycan/LPS O-acetylase OafA/YrhL
MITRTAVSPSPRLAALDGLRGVAVLMILIHHVVGLFLSLVSSSTLAVLAPRNWFEAAAVPFLCYTAGWLSWRVFEQPFVTIGHRVHYGLANTSLPS